jgi:hypothetical protein
MIHIFLLIPIHINMKNYNTLFITYLVSIATMDTIISMDLWTLVSIATMDTMDTIVSMEYIDKN